jgi:hypothetical protein
VQRLLLAGIVMLAAAAPARADDFTKLSVPKGSRIGVVSLVKPELVNMHLGFMVFSNFDKNLPNDWGLDRVAKDYTRELLSQNGYEAVEVAVDEPVAAGIRKQEDWSRLNYSGLDRNWAATYRRLMSENNVSALIVLREKLQPLGEYKEFHGIGIFSARFAEFFVSVMADAIGGEPPHRAVDDCLATRMFEMNLIEVKDYADITPNDLLWARPILESLLKGKLEFDLGSAGLLDHRSACPGKVLKKITSK